MNLKFHCWHRTSNRFHIFCWCFRMILLLKLQRSNLVMGCCPGFPRSVILLWYPVCWRSWEQDGEAKVLIPDPYRERECSLPLKGRAGLPHNGSSTIHLLYNYGDLDGVIYLPGQVVVYSDLPRTPTPTPVKNNTPTPVLSPTATPLPPQGNFVELVYSNDFSQNDLPSCGLLHIPGGYSGALSGTVQTNPFQPALFPNSADHKGLSITVRPGELVFVCTSTPIDTGDFLM